MPPSSCARRTSARSPSSNSFCASSRSSKSSLRFLFLNKIDKADRRVRETLKLLQPASRLPLLLRQIPIWKNEIIRGFVDLALERAFVYK